MRINARLDGSSSEQFEYIRKMTHKNVTEIIKHSVDLYYRELIGGQTDRNQRLLQSQFVGCGGAGKAFSAEYKAALNQGWDEKHDHR